MEASPDEQLFEASGLAKRRATTILYAVLCLAGLVGWVAIQWPVHDHGLELRVTWFGSQTLGWIFIVGVAVVLLYKAAAFAWEARQLTVRIRSLRSAAESFAHARVHRG